jgi:signal transduction histidine kinase
MGSLRWWYVSAWGAAVVLSALAFVEDGPIGRAIAASVAAILIAAVWSAFGRFAVGGAGPGIAVVGAVIVLAGAATGFESSMATLQCIAYPIVWIVLDRRRNAIVANVLLALSVGAGLYFGGGATPAALGVASTIEALSLTFSLGLGLWITNIAELGEERGRLLEELRAAQEQLSVLNRDAGAFGERERLAREIHDTIAQDLTGLVLTAQRGLRELRSGNTSAAETQLEVLEENARNALAETRALVASGAAVGVDIGGLATALGRLGERFQRETGIAVHVVADEAASLDRDGEVVLLRCAQEALANVRKHSAAASTTLTLAVHEHEISLSIADDGRGFDAGARSTGFGLDGMRERLAFVRGALVVIAAPGGGTTLVASVPTSREVTA